MKQILIGIAVGIAIIVGAAGIYNAGRDAVPRRTQVVEQTTDAGTTSTETPSVAPEEQQTPEPDVPRDYTAALESGRSYSELMHMSKARIYDQLTSSIEQFTPEAAQYAIDQLDLEVDWKTNALESARSYAEHMNMSTQRIYDQLTSSIEQFTPEEAQYAIDHL